MKKIVTLLILFSVFFSSACIVTFENPLTETSSVILEQQLLGRWQSVEEKEGIIEFSRDAKSGTTLSLFDEQSKKILFSVKSVEIGKYNYLSLMLIESGGDAKTPYLIARYEIVGDQMAVWLHKKDKIQELIDKGKLKGSKNAYGEISISNSSAELKRFLQTTESDNSFEYLGKFKKR